MSAGSINSGPLLIRIADTYLFSSFLNPVSSNFLLVTSTGGLLAPSNKIYVSSLAVSSCNASSITGSTILINVITGSSISTGNLYYSSLQANVVNVSTLRASTINLTNLTLSTFVGSSVFVNQLTVRSTMTVSSIQASNITFSTLAGSTITSNSVSALNVVGSTMFSGNLNVSTLIGSTLNVPFITASSIQGGNLVYSTMGGSTIVTSSMAVSTIGGRSAYVSTLGGSTVTANVVTASTMTGSTVHGIEMFVSSLTTSSLITNHAIVQNALLSALIFSTAQGSSLVTSTLSVSTLYVSTSVLSTLSGSTVRFSSLTGSTLFVGGMVASTMFGSTLTTSTALISSMTVGLGGFSTLFGSTVTANVLSVSTANGSTMIMNNGLFSTYQGSTLLISSLSASTVFFTNLTFSTSQGSTCVVSTLNISSVGNGSVVTTILQGSTMTVSTLTGSTLYVNSGVCSTLQGSSFVVSSVFASTMNAGLNVYSTITGNIVTVSSSVVSTMNINRMSVSTLNGSTVVTSTTVVSTLRGFVDLSFSTLNGSTLAISSLVGSSIVGGTFLFSTIAGSNVVSNTAVGTTVTASSISFNRLNATNLYGSTITANSLVVNSTLSVSTVNLNNLTYSTIVVTTATTSNINVISATVSSLTTNSLSATTYSVRHPVLGATNKKSSVLYPNNVVIKTSDIRATIDGIPSSAQTYTFGPTVPNRWVSTSYYVNTLGYSNDGFNWISLGSAMLGAGRYVAWNGSIWIAVGDAGSVSSIAYSYDGIRWTGIGNRIFSSFCIGVAWNGSMWVAVGGGINSIAYSYDGINWFGLGTSIFTGWGYSILWNGTMWVALGNPNNTIAYSYDGFNWIGLGASIFSSYGAGVAWNGRIWVAVGQGTNSIAYSYDGIRWTGLGNSITTNGIGVAWNGTMFVMGCSVSSPLTNSLAYSYDGIIWVGLGSSVFTLSGRNVGWNGAIWIAVGEGLNTIAYSYNGINWIGMGAGYGSNIGMSMLFNSTRPHCITFPTPMLVATGSGTNTLAYSPDGTTWTGSGTSIFSTQGNGVASNGAMWVATGSGTNTLAYSTTDIETPYIHLPFENGLFKDVMGNSNVTAYGSVTYVTGVRGSTAANLSNPGAGVSATNYLRGSWSGSSSFTVSLWFNMQSFDNSSNRQSAIFTAYNNNLILMVYTGSLSIYSNAAVQVSSPSQPAINTWYYATYIHQNNGLCSLYLNNSLVGTYINSGGLGTPSGNFCLGTYDVSQGTPFNGYIDDFRLYNYAITMNPRITWRGLGTSIFSTQGKNVAWNGSMWVAVGSGTNSIAYSYDGITWMGLGTSVLTQGNGVTWSGSMWIAVGSGTNSIAYSSNGLVWTGLGASIFTTGNGVAWNGTLWVTVGSGTNSIAYSYDGISWTGLGVSLFSSSGNSVAWNGSRWVAMGSGTNTILYSSNGISWVSAVSCFTTAGNSVTWNGVRWLAVGSGGNTIGYSNDGSTWAASQTISPNQSGLLSNTWTQNGVTWTANISSILNSDYPAYGAFNNYSGNTYTYSWASPSYYNISTGVYTLGPVTTPVASTTTVQGGVGTLSGEWLQIRSSIPLVLNSYRYGCGGYGNFPKSYYIIGSNDGSTWYPIQQCAMSVNPFTTNFTVCSTCVIVNQSGTQSIIGGQTGSGTFTTYSPYTTTAYTYFRLVGITLWAISTGGNMEAGELYLNFNNTTIFSAGTGISSNTGLPGTVTIQHPIVAVGSGLNSLAYSLDGVRWTGLGTTIFTAANSVAWNGSKWVACGTGSNTLAYSYDGLRWTALGATIFTAQAYGIAWSGSLWVAVGAGTNSIVYSTDGMGWGASATGNAIFTSCNAVAWSGSQWVAVGAGTNSIAYSADGKVWTAVSATIFSTQGNGVCWTGSLWVAVGSGTNSIAYSYDGVSWTGLGTTIFSTSGNGVCWNGTRWVAVGSGTNTLAYSMNGTSWIGLGANLLTTSGNGVCWTGTRFVAVGSGSISIIYSTDGLTWNIVSTVTPTIYLPFDGSSVDMMGRTVTVTGSPSYVTGSIGPQAINLANATITGTATQYVRVPITLSTTPSFTIYCLFNLSVTPTGQTVIWEVGTSTVNSVTLCVSVSSIYIQYQLTGGWSNTTIATSLSINTWYNITVIYAYGGTSYVYVNGALAATFTITTALTVAPNLLSIGCYTASTAGAFKGYIDDFKFYSMAITWSSDLSATVFTQGNGIAGNPRLGGVVCDSQISLIDSLDMVSDAYYNTGYTEMSSTVQAQTLVVDASTVVAVVKSAPGAPTAVSGALYPSGAASGIRVTFSYPDFTGGGIDEFYASAIDTALTQPTVTVSGAAPPITINGLVPGTTYRIQAYASNSAGQSVAAVAASNVFFQVPPSVPQNYVVALDPPTNPTGIAVSFTAPAISGGVTSYTVTAYQGLTQIGSAQTGSALSYTFTGFTVGTVYNFSAVGTNTGGVGSVINSSITYYTKPDAPSVTGVTLDPPTAPTGVNVAFTSGGNGGGVLTYVATAYLSGVATAFTASGSASPLKITGLTPGTSYTYKVVASNASVSSDVSLSSASLTYLEQPAAPSISSVTLNPPTDPSGINVAFTSGYTGGGTLTYVATAYLSGNVTAFTASGSSSPLTITGLTAGTPYTFKVVASNVSISSAASVASSQITYYTKPATPSVTGVTLDPANAPTGVNVAFTSGGNGGGVLTYVATAYIGGGATALTASGSASPLKITGLTPGTSYTYKVVASNASVSSDASLSSASLTYLEQPAAPTGVTASLTPALEPSGFSVAFTPSSNTGGGTLTYIATAYIGASPGTNSVPGSSSPLTINGLTVGTSYTFKVVAYNAAVSSNSSAASTPAVTYLIKPNPPTNLSATRTPFDTPTGVNVSFTSPAGYYGGSLAYVATAYSGSTAISSSSSLYSSPLYVTGLTVGTAYTFSIISNNSGIFSNVSSSVSLTYYTSPSVVRTVGKSYAYNSFFNQFGPGKVTIVWSAPATTGDGSTTISSYNVYSSNSGYNSGTLASSTTSVIIDVPAQSYIFHTYRITATNAAGYSSFVDI